MPVQHTEESLSIKVQHIKYTWIISIQVLTYETLSQQLTKILSQRGFALHCRLWDEFVVKPPITYGFE